MRISDKKKSQFILTFYFLDKSRTLARVSSETLHRQGKKLKLIEKPNYYENKNYHLFENIEKQKDLLKN